MSGSAKGDCRHCKRVAESGRRPEITGSILDREAEGSRWQNLFLEPMGSSGVGLVQDQQMVYNGCGTGRPSAIVKELPESEARTVRPLLQSRCGWPESESHLAIGVGRG